MDIWKGSADVSSNVQKMKTVQVWNIRQTIERPAVRCSNKDVIMARIRQVRSKSTENRLGNAIGQICCLTDVSCKTRLIECRTADRPVANQRNSGDDWLRSKSGKRKSRSGESENGQSRTEDTYHTYLLLQGKLVGENSGC